MYAILGSREVTPELRRAVVQLVPTTRPCRHLIVVRSELPLALGVLRRDVGKLSLLALTLEPLVAGSELRLSLPNRDEVGVMLGLALEPLALLRFRELTVDGDQRVSRRLAPEHQARPVRCAR